MNCINCGNTMTLGLYRCNLNSYDIIDENENVILVWKTHNIPSDNVEIGDTSQVYYCEDCMYLRKA